MSIPNCRAVSGLLATIVPFVLAQTGAADNRWVQLGPAGGMVYVISVSPDSADSVVAGTYYGGPFASITGGESWSPSNSGLSDTRAFAYLDSGAGTFVGTPSGIFRRFGSPYWSQSSGGLTTKFVYALVTDWTANNRLFAGTNGGGVFRSNDKGASWQQIKNELTNLTVRTLVMDGNIGTLFAGTLGGGVFRAGSLEQADPLWQPINTGLDDKTVNCLIQASSSTLHAGTNSGVFRTRDRGLHWERASTGLPSGRVTGLDFDPAQTSTLYAATPSGLFKSLDAGDSWATAGDGLPAAGATCVAVAGSNPSVVYAGTYLGVYKSTDAGATWVAKTADLWDSDVLALAADPTATSTILAGLPNAGVLRTTSAQPRWDVASSLPSWSLANTGLTDLSVTALLADPVQSGVFYAGTASGVFKSSDRGLTWAFASLGLQAAAITSLTADSAAGGIVYAGTYGAGVYRTRDGAATWAPAGSGIADSNINTVAADPTASLTLYAGTGDGVFKTQDGGDHWSAASAGLTNRNVMALVVDPTAPLTVYAGTLGNGVFRSTDGGASWAATSASLTSGNVMALAMTPTTPPVVYAGTWGGGVFASSDNGETWSQLVTDMTERHVATLLAPPAGANMVLAGTCGGLRAGLFGTCTLACGVTAPSTAAPGATFTIRGPEVRPSGCLGAVTYDWDLGDGSPHLTTSSATYAYQNTGAYTWHLTAAAGTTVCKTSGTITVSSLSRVRRHLRRR
ncbi:MAG: hypothetical protein LAO05_10050 [Acidobacteriia bacterium]|nr:hypothetical protein [Terriglobia bacterium]